MLNLSRTKSDKVDPAKFTLNFKLNKEQKRKAIDKMLAENMPAKRLFILTVLFSISAVILITFQIVSISLKAPLYYTYSGIWAGLSQIAATYSTINLIRKRTFHAYKVFLYCTRVCLLLVTAVTIIFTVDSVGCNKFFHCSNYQLEWVNMVMMPIAVIAQILASLSMRAITDSVKESGMVMVAENAVNEAGKELKKENSSIQKEEQNLVAAVCHSDSSQEKINSNKH